MLALMSGLYKTLILKMGPVARYLPVNLRKSFLIEVLSA